MRQLAKYGTLAIVLVVLVAIGVRTGLRGVASIPVASAGNGAPSGTAIPAATASVPPPPTATVLVGIPTTPDTTSRAPTAAIPAVSGISEGTPALVPSTPNAPLGTPTFGEADVRLQIAALGTRLGDWTTPFYPTAPATISSVEFLSAQQIGVRLNRGMNMPDDRMLCFVVLTGGFTGYGLGEPGVPTPRPVTTVRLIFDARTGNLIAVTGGR